MYKEEDQTAEEKRTAPLHVVPMQIPTDKDTELAALLALNIKSFQRQQAAKKARLESELAQTEFEDLELAYKLKHGLPLDKRVHLITGQPV